MMSIIIMMMMMMMMIINDLMRMHDDQHDNEYFGCCCWLWSIRHLRSAVFSRSVEQEQVFLRGSIFVLFARNLFGRVRVVLKVRGSKTP